MSVHSHPAEPARVLRLPHSPLLPVPRTSFVGRDAEVARAAELLQHSRLLTLLGPGGCGKTRLALRLAGDLVDEFPGGSAFVDLGPLDRGGRVMSRVAETLGVEEPESGGPLSEAVCERLGASRALVILDGCEHVVVAAADVVAALLTGAPGLSILATSQQPLAVDGELTWNVPPMTEADAVALFEERTRAVRPDRPLGAGDGEAVADVCRRLDGLPLGIELAAARTRALSPRQIAAGLERRFELLANGPRTVPARHATLRASMAWSYELLDTEVQALLRHLAVFAGSFGLDAVEAVLPTVALEQLASLAEHSLLVVEDAPDETRYRLAETVRAFALEELVSAGEADEARDRHRDHCIAEAEAAEPMVSGPGQHDAMRRLGADHDNVVAALAWCRDRGQPEPLARLAAAMTPYWLEGSHWSECRTWLDAAASSGDVLPGLRAEVLNCLCYLETWVGNWAVVPGLAGEALTLARNAGRRREEGRALGYLAVITALAMGADPARPYFEDAAAIARSVGDSWGVANLLTFFSLSRVFQSDPGEVNRLLEEATTTARERGDGRSLRLARVVAGLSAATQGRVAEAAGLADAVDDARVAEHWSALIIGLSAQGWLRMLQGDAEGALRAGREGVDVARQSGEARAFQALAMSVCGRALHQLNDGAEALRVLGDAVELMRASELPRWVGLPLVFVAELQLDAGDASGAQQSLDEATAVASAAGYSWILGRAEHGRARLLSAAGDEEAAESHLHRAFDLHQQAGDVIGRCDSIDRLAAVNARRGHPDIALRLWAAAETGRAALDCSPIGPGSRHREAAMSDARRAIGHLAERVWEEGTQLDLDRAVAFASRHRGKRGRPSTGWASLTHTEIEVTRLVGRHLTNVQIAEQLFVSRATIKTHLVHIFSKLGIAGRSQLAAEAMRRGLE